jgi:2-polyprenyl-3-methyl-5-hydroxy-6-metoxy-1,4-benzoquinol methylase
MLYAGEAIYRAPSPELFQQLAEGFENVVKELGLFGMNGGSLLEVGCNAGYALSVFQAHGWAVAGVEINTMTRAAARARLNTPIYETLDQIPECEAYDVVIMSHVLEHIIDPISFLRKMLDRVKPNGVVYVRVPNYGSYSVRYIVREKWPAFLPLQHVWYFDRQSLAGLLHAVGLNVVALYTRERFSFSASNLLKAAVKAPIALASRLLRYDGSELVGVFQAPPAAERIGRA